MSKYKVNINWSEEDQVYIARVPELDGVNSYGDTLIETAKHVEEAIELHLESLKARGKSVPKPVAELNLSGNVSLRMGQELHEAAHLAAEAKGESLNEYICGVLKKNGAINEIDDLDEGEQAELEELFSEKGKVARVALPRTEVIKKLWAYTKRHNLFDRPSKKKDKPIAVTAGMMKHQKTRTAVTKAKKK